MVGIWRCTITVTSTILSLVNDLIHFHHFFHDLKYRERRLFCYTVRCCMRSYGISRTTSTISSIMTGDTPSISNQTTNLRSTLEEHSFVNILYIHAGTCIRQNAVQSVFPRSVHVAEVVSLALVSNCLHLRLIVWT